MAIKFLLPYTVKDAAGTQYKQGQVVKDLPAASELHFIRKGVAIEMVAKKKAK